MKRQLARTTRVQREVLRLRTEGREFSKDTMRKAKEQADEDLDHDFENQLRWNAERVEDDDTGGTDANGNRGK